MLPLEDLLLKCGAIRREDGVKDSRVGRDFPTRCEAPAIMLIALDRIVEFPGRG